jgi:hypothetical protein
MIMLSNKALATDSNSPRLKSIVRQEVKMETLGELRIRRHGNTGPTVLVLRGGPGAVGSAEELACG